MVGRGLSVALTATVVVGRLMVPAIASTTPAPPGAYIRPRTIHHTLGTERRALEPRSGADFDSCP